jgi:dihydrofolate reductase
MIISIIVAVAENGGIGLNNNLLWHLPDDLKRFKKLTMGKPVIMGRKTFESIGKPLPGRVNIVISRNEEFSSEGIIVVSSFANALEAAAETDPDEVFIIGGGAIYKETMGKTDRLYITKVQATPDADTFFEIDYPENWQETARENHPADARHAFAFDFIDYQRV